ncbi:hypothetical protein [Endozoicomonas sp. ONNA1]|uniref:hypothetical protein n=1 Tax=Endozoicomonas sp. ONNA1 TaxID=2828740 RepID=UPI0021483F82|nr:hypothetical protein [Endozoicomonas sp. ONNA1]
MSRTNLKRQVLDILAEVSPKTASKAKRQIPECRGGLKEQLHAMNKYWRLQLGLCPEPTIAVREYLSDNLVVTEWLEYFKHLIVPYIVRNDLPKY